ncbi:MAG TPA: isocitrate/isopropylmalate dehydrogenase family protein [Methanomicrobia archaeon]|nr:isocitrate/isopropylmalate dehydrogenase family protein [Methanomicrobia archaeon]HEX58643.1 isocitrate/isopropylmalate dehydrogenase family protein [Methanomicrobia archaeon]
MKKVAVIRGDGVGPEVVDAAFKVLGVVEPDVEWLFCDAGYDWWQEHGGDSLIPEETWDVLEEADACLKGPTTTPGGEGSPKSVAVSIRQHFDLYANVRPIKTFEGTRRPLGDVDFVCVREATEGLYFGVEIPVNDDIILALRKITRRQCHRIAKFAFEEARRRKFKAVVAIHKSNILKRTCGAFVEEARKVAEEYPEIELWEYHVDNIAQQLIKNPQIFNETVLLSTNLFMDIISEECSALVGSIGLIPSANIGDDYAMFEPAHGSAPKYAGLDKVNPTAMILASAWLLEYLGEVEKATVIRRAVEEVIAESKTVTYDLGGNAKLSEMADAVARRAERILS